MNKPALKYLSSDRNCCAEFKLPSITDGMLFNTTRRWGLFVPAFYVTFQEITAK